jgi:hypothetical protein
MPPASASFGKLISAFGSSGTSLRIYLHLSRCRRTAEVLGVHPKDLVEVVWTHEAAHFVSHVGSGGSRAVDWKRF